MWDMKYMKGLQKKRKSFSGWWEEHEGYDDIRNSNRVPRSKFLRKGFRLSCGRKAQLLPCYRWKGWGGGKVQVWEENSQKQSKLVLSKKPSRSGKRNGRLFFQVIQVSKWEMSAGKKSWKKMTMKIRSGWSASVTRIVRSFVQIFLQGYE